MKRIFILSLLLLIATTILWSQEKPSIFVDKIEGPDPFICERYQMLFMEEIVKLKNVKLASKKEDAQYILSGIGRLDDPIESTAKIVQNGDSGVASARSGQRPNALLSIKLIKQDTDEIMFVGNRSDHSGLTKGATHSAVINIMKDIKKKMKWK